MYIAGRGRKEMAERDDGGKARHVMISTTAADRDTTLTVHRIASSS